jgi:dTDP-4-dehydrorhamnose 3,5-epimerase
MKFEPLAIEGVFEVTPERREDARGFFARIFCEEEFAEQGLNTRWVQMNISLSREAGTLRGLHFQRPPKDEVKLVRCLQGCALDIVVDLRSESITYGKHLMCKLDPVRRNAIYIPTGCAHGFQTLAADTELQYFHSATYAPEAEGGVSPLDPDLDIKWPLAVVELSDRDRALPSLNECKPL